MQLLERQSHLDELARRLRESGQDAGKLVFVSGEAGAGKSALIEEFAAQSAPIASTFWGHCDALDTSRVLGAVIDLFMATAASDIKASPALPERELLFTQLLEQLSHPNRLSIVVLEDLHWADDATLDFVHFLGRRIQRTRCLLVCTYRSDEISSSHPLRRILGDFPPRHTLRLHLAPLSLAAVEQLGRTTAHDA